MDPQTVTSITDMLAKGGLVTGLVAVLIGGYFQVWVWGKQLREERADWLRRLTEMTADRDLWRDVALQSVDLSHRSLTKIVRSEVGVK